MEVPGKTHLGGGTGEITCAQVPLWLSVRAVGQRKGQSLTVSDRSEWAMDPDPCYEPTSELVCRRLCQRPSVQVHQVQNAALRALPKLSLSWLCLRPAGTCGSGTEAS